MSTGYAIAYRLGITPWERAGRGAGEHFTHLIAREEADRAAPWGAPWTWGAEPEATPSNSPDVAGRPPASMSSRRPCDEPGSGPTPRRPP